MSHAIDLAAMPLHWGRNAARVIGSPLPADLKRRVLRTQAGLELKSLATAGSREPVQQRIVGFDVRAYSWTGLSFLFREIFVDLDYYFTTAKPAPYILDCGSNIGMALLFFKALYPGARVIGFEPGPDSFELLQHNVTANRLTDVDVHAAAVGQDESTIEFYRAKVPGSVTSSTRIERTGGLKTVVRQVRLSRFIDREVDFLKLDVEGGEWAVIEELIAADRLQRIDQMVIEYHHHIAPSEDRFGEFLRLLESQGFGYQLRANADRARERREFQDILVYAYQKRNVEAR